VVGGGDPVTSRLAPLVAIAMLARLARADIAMSQDGVAHETPVALAAVRLGNALRVVDIKELADATKAMATATAAFSTWLGAHPRERTDAVIETAANKLVATADHLRTELDAKADPELIHQTAIDAVHRFNGVIGAHQGDPPPPEVAIPHELRDAFIAMNERVGARPQDQREAQRAKPDTRGTQAVAPLRACRSNATVRAYFDRTDF
jgi:hypothetical protein